MDVNFLNEGKDVYVLYSCDQWKSHDSMRTLGVFGSEKSLRKAIKKEVKLNNFEIDDESRIDKDDLSTLGSVLDYGCFDKFTLQ